jgi:hypothetical protein
MMYENNYAGGGITTLPGYFWGGFLVTSGVDF